MNINNYRYCNQHLYSDINPFEIIKIISNKTMEIKAMYSVKKENSSQYDQQWVISSDEAGKIKRIRKHKDGFFYDKNGIKYILSDKPIKVYDNNY